MTLILLISNLYADSDCLLDQCEPKSENPISEQTSVLGTALKTCGTSPMTGYFRDGFCHTNEQDRGVHVVCAQMTAAFLNYTKAQGNDLSTAKPQYNFPGLKPGDHWCLCAARWQEANLANVAPTVKLESTHQKALQTVSIFELTAQATPQLNK